MKKEKYFSERYLKGKNGKRFLAFALSMIMVTACSPRNTAETEKKEEGSSVLTSVEEPAKQAENKGTNTEAKTEQEKSSVAEAKDPATEPKEEEAVKNKEHVPADSKENDFEQRRIELPEIDLGEAQDVFEAVKDVTFADFNLDVQNPQQIKDIDSLFVLANKANYFPEDYKPKNLVVPAIPFSFSGENEKKYLQKPAADALTVLINAAAREGIAISGVSGYRSIARQKVIYKYNVDTYGQSHADKYSAKPMYSEHHTGLCMDVSSASVSFGLVEKYGDTKEGKWLADNAHKYGFVIRYPKGKEEITGYSYEPWHIRYLGVPLASYLYENGLCYEEFVAAMQQKEPVKIEPKAVEPNQPETPKAQTDPENPEKNAPSDENEPLPKEQTPEKENTDSDNKPIESENEANENATENTDMTGNNNPENNSATEGGSDADNKEKNGK